MLTREQILALPTGRELDALVSRVVGDPEGCHYVRYSTDHAAAFAAVEALSARGCRLRLRDGRHYLTRPGWWAMFVPLAGGDADWQVAATVPHAICLAVLLATIPLPI